MNFCTACGTQLLVDAQFCSSCGQAVVVHPTAPVPSPPSAEETIEDRAESLLTIAKSADSSEEQIDDILEDHAECFEDELCEVCEYLEEELFEDLLGALSQNAALTADQQVRVLLAALEWQGRITSVIRGLAANPSVCGDAKEDVLSAAEFVAPHVDDDLPEYLSDIRTLMSANPAFTEDDLQEFDQRNQG